MVRPGKGVFSNLEKGEVLTPAATRMSLEEAVLSEMSRSQKAK